MFRKRNLDVQIRIFDPDQSDAKNLLQECIKLIEKFDMDIDKDNNKDRAIVIFDADTLNDTVMKTVSDLSNKYGIEVYISNPFFEHWLILHFKEMHKIITQDYAEKELTRLIGFKYVKGDKNVYKLLDEPHKERCYQESKRSV